MLLVTILATVLLLVPIIFSPINAFAPTFDITGKSTISKVGLDSFKDSYSIKEVIEITKGRYNNNLLREFFNK